MIHTPWDTFVPQCIYCVVVVKGMFPAIVWLLLANVQVNSQQVGEGLYCTSREQRCRGEKKELTLVAAVLPHWEREGCVYWEKAVCVCVCVGGGGGGGQDKNDAC